MTRIRFEDLPSRQTPINAENLDKLNNVAISTTEPTTGEEVWVEAGKNLFDKSVRTSTGDIITYYPVSVKQNTDYTLSTNAGSSSTTNVFLTTTASGASTSTNGARPGQPRTINSGNNTTLYVACRTDLSSYWIQLEKGAVATPYEPYVNPSIKVNVNGEYETIYEKPVVLFEGRATETVTLSQNVSNFTCLEVYYQNSSGATKAVKRIATSGSGLLDYVLLAQEGSNIAWYSRNSYYEVSGNTITHKVAFNYHKYSNNTTEVLDSTATNIYITKVLGIK